MNENQHSARRPSVIPRSDIPSSDVPEGVAVDVRSFDAHAILSEVVPRPDVEMTWIHASSGQEVPVPSHTGRRLLVVLGGGAELTGGTFQRTVGQGDVVTVPAGEQCDFRGVADDGIHVLQVSFSEAPPTAAPRDEGLAQLLARNEARVRTTLENPFFQLISSGAVRDPRCRVSMGEALRVFSDAFQSILFTRQATCRDPRFMHGFHQHLTEELGHNELLKVSGRSRATCDPILRASSAWFCHQMLVQDNAGKTVINLVLETAGYHFHTLASGVLSEDESADYFQVHADDDEAHMEIGLHQLRGLSRENFERLSAVLEDAWDMFEVVSGRIARLAQSNGDGPE